MNHLIFVIISAVAAERSAGNVALIEKNTCIRNCHIGPASGNTPQRIQCERDCNSEFDRIKADCEAGVQRISRGLDLCSSSHAQLPVPINPSQHKAHQECITQCRQSTNIDGEVCQMGCSLKLETIQQDCQRSGSPDPSACQGVPTRSVDPTLPTPTDDSTEEHAGHKGGPKPKGTSTSNPNNGIVLVCSLPFIFLLASTSFI
ncbi:hypothetical protein DSO57_1010508 [Entomophthora muscae]|uniref:Uncharacterized protein n=1 Tax=Entomophthora muscae TaxID=34485 RepID=A0ACC2T6L8_9FUNG|nr:hypothetical protein DSO57_1010508 [Entomophthora muscae]